jgi:DNA-binding MarR family transcriptional regulator
VPPVSDFGQLQRPQPGGVLMVRRGDDHLIGVSFVHRLGEIGPGPVDSYIIIIYKYLMHLLELVYDVGRLHRLMTQFAGRDLGQSEAAALSAVAQHPRRITELSQVLDLTQPRVTIVVASLVDQGLLQRTADPGDGRAVVLELTARGVEVARERHRRVSESLQTLLADRTPGSDALIEATATHLRDLVSELEAALAEAAVRR